MMYALLLSMLPQATFDAGAPHGTDLEWLIVLSVLAPAVVVIVLVYVGSKNTV